MRFAVETWAPEYGVAADAETLEDGGERVDVDVEVPTAAWAPIFPSGPRAERLMFVDGVRRIDARVWITDDDGVHAGVCASVAAGAVVVNGGGACVVEHRVERAVVAAGARAGGEIATVHGRYGFVPAQGDDPDAVYLAIHELMTALEARVATAPDCDVVVFDGPLRGRNDAQAVGYVKTQRVQYLPDDLMPVLVALGDGERTPLFLIGGRGFSRWSCYVRLPGATVPSAVGHRSPGAPGSGRRRRRRRPGRPGGGDAPPVRQRAAQGAAGAAEPVPDRRPRAAPAPPPRRPVRPRAGAAPGGGRRVSPGRTVRTA